MLATRFALAVSRGEQWLGFDTPKDGIDTLYLQLEIPNPMLQERIKKMVDGKPLPKTFKHKLFIWTNHTLKIDTDEGYKELEAKIELYKPKVLIIDPIYKIVSGDMLSTDYVRKLVDWIDTIVDKYGLSVLMVHHTKKGVQDEAWGNNDDMLGSVIFSAWADTIIKVERKESSKLMVKFETVRHATEEILPKEFTVDLKNLSFIPTGRVI